MTDVSNLDDLANKIQVKGQENIVKYAKAQAAATQSQETAIRALQKEVELLNDIGRLERE